MAALASLGEVEQELVTQALRALAKDWRNRNPHERPGNLPDELTLVTRIAVGLPLVPTALRQNGFSNEVLHRLSTIPTSLLQQLGLDPDNFTPEHSSPELD